MSGECPSNSITGFPLQSKETGNFSENDYKAPGIDYETGLVDLQWGSELPAKKTGRQDTRIFLQNEETDTSSVIYGGLKFNLFNVQIVNKTHEKFVTDTSITASNYFYDLFILLKNSELSFIAFIIPIKEDTGNTTIDPDYFTAAIPPSAGVTPKSGTLSSTIPIGKTFVHYDTCFNAALGTTDKRKNLDVFLSTYPIVVKESTIRSIIGYTGTARPNNLYFILPPNFISTTSASGTSNTPQPSTSIGKNELYNYIQTTTFGIITNIGDKSARVGIITDTVDEYKCYQLDPDKIDNNTCHIDRINGEQITDLDTILQERTALKSIMNGEASGGTDAQGRVRNRAAYATALAVIITVICLSYIGYSILVGKPADTREKLQYIVAFLSVIFLFTSCMLYLNSDKKSEAQWVGITGGVISFLYWLFFYALFPAKKECDTPGSATPATPATPAAPATPATQATAAADDSGMSFSKILHSELLRTIIIVVIVFLSGFIFGNING